MYVCILFPIRSGNEMINVYIPTKARGMKYRQFNTIRTNLVKLQYIYLYSFTFYYNAVSHNTAKYKDDS